MQLRSAPRTTPAPVAAPVQAPELGRVRESLGRLAEAIETFQAGADQPPFGAYAGGADPFGGSSLPERGVGLETTVDELVAAISEGCRIGAPGFWGFITTASTTAPALAETAMAFAGGQRYLLHAFNAIEHLAIRWLAELCGLPAGVTGVLTSGGSTANLVALGAARQAALERQGVDVAEEGLPPGFQGRIYASALAHRTVHRSAGVLGLGRRGVAEMPVDVDGRIDLAALESAMAADQRRGIVPIAVVGIAGSTDTGSVDDLAGLAAIAARHGTWLHVDGAYGLIANASPTLAPLFRGVELADSWIVDPHKWLATGVGVGAAFVRDGDVLRRGFAEGTAGYLEGAFSPAEAQSQFDAMGGSWADEAVELSAPPRGVMVWAILREIGRAGVIARVDRDAGYARRVAERAEEEPRLELLMEPQLSVTCFRYCPPGTAPADAESLTARIIERLRRETGFVPTTTIVGGRLAIRPCFINPHTRPADVDGLVDAVLRIGDDLVSHAGAGGL